MVVMELKRDHSNRHHWAPPVKEVSRSHDRPFFTLSLLHALKIKQLRNDSLLYFNGPEAAAVKPRWSVVMECVCDTEVNPPLPLLNPLQILCFVCSYVLILPPASVKTNSEGWTPGRSGVLDISVGWGCLVQCCLPMLAPLTVSYETKLAWLLGFAGHLPWEGA